MTSPVSVPTPPTRPVPPAPASPATASPAPATLPSVDDEVDLSTLRFLRTSFRSPFLPWLVRLAVGTLAAKLTGWLAPPLLRLVARLAALVWSALVALVRFAAWAGFRLGLLGLTLWLLVGLGGALVYLVLSLKPRWRGWARSRPAQARLVRKGAQYGSAWVLARKVLGMWAAKAVVVVYAGWEAWLFFSRRPTLEAAASQAPTKVQAGATRAEATAAPSVGNPDEPFAGEAPGSDSPVLSAATPAAEEEEGGDPVDDEELERWARQAKEALLRDSLLRQGRRAGSSGVNRSNADVDPEADQDASEVGGDAHSGEPAQQVPAESER